MGGLVDYIHCLCLCEMYELFNKYIGICESINKAKDFLFTFMCSAGSLI